MAGCASPSRPSDDIRVDTLETGRVFVANPVPSDVARLSLVEELRLGLAVGEDPYVFGNVGSLAARGDGSIIVADFISKEIREFSPDGVFRRVVLRQGRGPNELQFRLNGVDLLWQPPGRLWIGDPPRLMFLDPSGNLRRTSFDLGSTRWPARSDTFGVIYREALRLNENMQHRWIEAYRLLGGDTLGQVREELPLETVELRARVYRRGRSEVHWMFDRPLRSEVIWDVDPSGDLWLLRSGTYDIHRVRLNGDTVRTIRVPVEPRLLEDRELDRAAQNTPFSPEELPVHQPLIVDFRVDREGWIWVRRTNTDSATPLVDVFDDCGRHVGSALSELADHEPWLAMGSRRILGVVRDELDVEYVIRLRLERNNGAPVVAAPCVF